MPPFRRFVALLAAPLAAVIVLAGCSSSEDNDTADVAEGCAAESTSGTTRPIPIPPAQVTVTEPGAEPRAVAGAAPNRESAQQITLTTTSTQASVGESSSQTVEIPLQARFGCADSTNIEMTLGAASSPDITLDDALDPVEGSAAGMSIGPGLMPASLRLIPDEEASSQARSAVEQSLIQALQTSIPLPTEPIGLGATWVVERTVNAATRLNQRIEATLTGWAGNRVTLTFTAEETPANSIFRIPGTTNETLTISRYSYTGSGEVTYDLGRGLPLSGTYEYSGARELVGAGDPLLQQLGFTALWRE